MSETPSDRRYLETHEWFKPEGDLVVVGITQFAADELTDVTYAFLPKVGDTLEAGARFGEVESVKATSDLFTGMAGTIVAVNDTLSSDPGLINRDPYHAGWIMKLKPADASAVNTLLSVEAYLKKIGH